MPCILGMWSNSFNALCHSAASYTHNTLTPLSLFCFWLIPCQTIQIMFHPRRGLSPSYLLVSIYLKLTISNICPYCWEGNKSPTYLIETDWAAFARFTQNLSHHCQPSQLPNFQIQTDPCWTLNFGGFPLPCRKRCRQSDWIYFSISTKNRLWCPW